MQDPNSRLRTGPSLSDFLGTYVGQSVSLDCEFELHLSPYRTLAGSLKAAGEILKVHAAALSTTGVISGALIETHGGATFAVFRASLEGDGLLLELDVSGPDHEVDFSDAEQLRLVRAVRHRVNRR